MLEEIDAALDSVKAKGISFKDMRRGDFPLGKTTKLLAESYDDLNAGPGFAVVGGLPVDRYSYEENLLVYSGIASYFGGIVVQNYEGDFVVDVVDTVGGPWGEVPAFQCWSNHAVSFLCSASVWLFT